MHSKIKTKILKKALSLTMLFVIALPLICSCAKSNVVKTNIEITPENQSYTYSAESISYAQNAIYTCLYSYEKAREGSVSQKDIENLQKKSKKLQSCLPSTIDQDAYNSFFFTLSSNSKDIADGLNMIRGNDAKTGFEKLEKVYRALIDVVNKDYIAEVIYNYILVSCDEKYEAQMKAYNEYGYDYMLDKANEYLEMKDIVKTDIGKGNIVRLINYFFFVGNLYYGTGFDGAQLISFTEEEILIFIKSIDLSSLSITEKGYELIIASYGESIINDTNKTFFDKVMFEAYNNGDSQQMAIFTREMISLIASAQKDITLDDVELLKDKETKSFFYSLIQHFDDEAWVRFDNACKQKINVEKYNALAKSYYKEDFEVYLENTSPATIEELKDACGTDSFNQTLEEYIFGICPAFSYDMKF